MFGAADDDDLDFNPVAGSKLASLFGQERSEKGNASLTYTAPKQPKHYSPDDSPSARKPSIPGITPSASQKLSLIVAKAVSSFKLEDGKYSPQGKLGLALLGNTSTHFFKLLLYKGKTQQITSVRVTPSFQFTVQPHLYASFYDDRTQNWSVLFDNNDDAMDFSAQVAAARYRSVGNSEECLVTQEIMPGTGSVIKEGQTVTLNLSAQEIAFDSVQAVDLKQAIIDCSFTDKLAPSGWSAGLLGAAVGSKWVILVPASMEVPWLKSKRSGPLLVVASVSNFKNSDNNSKEADRTDLQKFRVSASVSGMNSPVDSSAEDSSVRGRGATIKEALTSSLRPNKASIISRMARMGQATLPLKGAIACNPSDSEETEEDSSNLVHSKPQLKARPGKNRSGPSVNHQKPILTQSNSHDVSIEKAAQSSTSIRQTAANWSQPNSLQPMSDSSLVKIVSSEGQLFSFGTQPQLPLIATNSVISPSDPTPHMSMFLSEARMQNTEVRMHLNKFNDKMDQIITKIDDLKNSSASPGSAKSTGVVLEPNILLSSIEKIVSENQRLQLEVEEKNKRLDEQNERIFSLLNTNSKFLEQSNFLLEQKQSREQMQQNQEDQQNYQDTQSQLIQQLQEEKISLGKQLASLQNQLVSIQELVQALQKNNSDVNQELGATRARLLEKERILKDVDSTRNKSDNADHLFQLNKELEKQKSENIQLLKDIAELRHNYESQKESADKLTRSLTLQHTMDLAQMKEQISSEVENYRSTINNLELKCAELTSAIQNQGVQAQSSLIPSQKLLIDDVKAFVNILHKRLYGQFPKNDSFFGSQIRTAISSIVKKEALEFVSRLEAGTNQTESVVEVTNSSTASSQENSYHTFPEGVKDQVNTQNEISSAESKVASETVIKTDFPSDIHLISSTNGNKELGDAVEIEESKKDSDSFLQASWRPSPPPPPFFHDEEDSDEWPN